MDYLALLNSLPMGVLLLSDKGKIVFYNQKVKKILQTSDDIINSFWSDVVDSEFKIINDQSLLVASKTNIIIEIVSEPYLTNKGQMVLIYDKGLHQPEKSKNLSSEIIIIDSNSKKTYELAKKLASSDITVLINGESGTGKEVLAKYIHMHSPRKDQPYIAINCAAIPENMLEAMLFGYEKGAFTGAHTSMPGKFEQANNGTLLLDEISEMPINLQAKMLRVIQEKEVERLGGKKLIDLDVRIIATTNKNLMNEVKENNFRKDLYYRLSVFPLNILPLKQRKNDIIPLAEYILQSKSSVAQLSNAAAQKLAQYHWPGNVRELMNVMLRSIVLMKNNIVKAEDIVFESEEIAIEDIKDLDSSLNDQKINHEYQVIIETIKSQQGNKNNVAKELGISPRTLRYKIAKMKKLGIKIPIYI